jgi:site-specific DNA-methyltransferase (adenine-specific)
VKPYYEEDGITIYHGDCENVLPELPEASFDACITDPPYGLSKNKQRSPQRKCGVGQNKPGFMGMQWDARVPGAEVWAGVLRALKPGAHTLAFGGTRTHHRLMCAIEDAGFEIRDVCMWLYGSGFPKSLDISKAIDKTAGAERLNIGTRQAEGGRNYESWRAKEGRTDLPPNLHKVTDIPVTLPPTDAAKQFDGYGTALKPAWEPIILGMKPTEGTFAENALSHGVAGLNVDGSRIATDETLSFGSMEIGYGVRYGKRGRNGEASADRRHTESGGTNFAATPGPRGGDPAGRWPANLILDKESAALLDQQSGVLSSGGYPPLGGQRSHVSVYSKPNERGEQRFTSSEGGASRFFYCAKADSAERGTGNNHPTVKPLDLMRYLVKLLAPPSGGIFLEPFMGSGTTLIACKAMGIKAVGIEQEEKYCEIAAKRLSQGVLELTA